MKSIYTNVTSPDVVGQMHVTTAKHELPPVMTSWPQRSKVVRKLVPTPSQGYQHRSTQQGCHQQSSSPSFYKTDAFCDRAAVNLLVKRKDDNEKRQTDFVYSTNQVCANMFPLYGESFGDNAQTVGNCNSPALSYCSNDFSPSSRNKLPCPYKERPALRLLHGEAKLIPKTNPVDSCAVSKQGLSSVELSSAQTGNHISRRNELLGNAPQDVQYALNEAFIRGALNKTAARNEYVKEGNDSSYPFALQTSPCNRIICSNSVLTSNSDSVIQRRESAILPTHHCDVGVNPSAIVRCPLPHIHQPSIYEHPSFRMVPPQIGSRTISEPRAIPRMVPVQILNTRASTHEREQSSSPFRPIHPLPRPYALVKDSFRLSPVKNDVIRSLPLQLVQKTGTTGAANTISSAHPAVMYTTGSVSLANAYGNGNGKTKTDSMQMPASTVAVDIFPYESTASPRANVMYNPALPESTQLYVKRSATNSIRPPTLPFTVVDTMSKDSTRASCVNRPWQSVNSDTLRENTVNSMSMLTPPPFAVVKDFCNPSLLRNEKNENTGKNDRTEVETHCVQTPPPIAVIKNFPSVASIAVHRDLPLALGTDRVSDNDCVETHSVQIDLCGTYKSVVTGDESSKPKSARTYDSPPRVFSPYELNHQVEESLSGCELFHPSPKSVRDTTSENKDIKKSDIESESYLSETSKQSGKSDNSMYISSKIKSESKQEKANGNEQAAKHGFVQRGQGEKKHRVKQVKRRRSSTGLTSATRNNKKNKTSSKPSPHSNETQKSITHSQTALCKSDSNIINKESITIDNKQTNTLTIKEKRGLNIITQETKAKTTQKDSPQKDIPPESVPVKLHCEEDMKFKFPVKKKKLVFPTKIKLMNREVIVKHSSKKGDTCIENSWKDALVQPITDDNIAKTHGTKARISDVKQKHTKHSKRSSIHEDFVSTSNDHKLGTDYKTGVIPQDTLKATETSKVPKKKKSGEKSIALVGKAARDKTPRDITTRIKCTKNSEASTNSVPIIIKAETKTDDKYKNITPPTTDNKTQRKDISLCSVVIASEEFYVAKRKVLETARFKYRNSRKETTLHQLSGNETDSDIDNRGVVINQTISTKKVSNTSYQHGSDADDESELKPKFPKKNMCISAKATLKYEGGKETQAKERKLGVISSTKLISESEKLVKSKHFSPTHTSRVMKSEKNIKTVLKQPSKEKKSEVREKDNGSGKRGIDDKEKQRCLQQKTIKETKSEQTETTAKPSNTQSSKSRSQTETTAKFSNTQSLNHRSQTGSIATGTKGHQDDKDEDYLWMVGPCTRAQRQKLRDILNEKPDSRSETRTTQGLAEKRTSYTDYKCDPAAMKAASNSEPNKIANFLSESSGTNDGGSAESNHSWSDASTGESKKSVINVKGENRLNMKDNCEMSKKLLTSHMMDTKSNSTRSILKEHIKEENCKLKIVSVVSLAKESEDTKESYLISDTDNAEKLTTDCLNDSVHTKSRLNDTSPNTQRKRGMEMKTNDAGQSPGKVAANPKTKTDSNEVTTKTGSTYKCDSNVNMNTEITDPKGDTSSISARTLSRTQTKFDAEAIDQALSLAIDKNQTVVNNIENESSKKHRGSKGTGGIAASAPDPVVYGGLLGSCIKSSIRRSSLLSSNQTKTKRKRVSFSGSSTVFNIDRSSTVVSVEKIATIEPCVDNSRKTSALYNSARNEHEKKRLHDLMKTKWVDSMDPFAIAYNENSLDANEIEKDCQSTRAFLSSPEQNNIHDLLEQVFNQSKRKNTDCEVSQLGINQSTGIVKNDDLDKAYEGNENIAVDEARIEVLDKTKTEEKDAEGKEGSNAPIIENIKIQCKQSNCDKMTSTKGRNGTEMSLKKALKNKQPEKDKAHKTSFLQESIFESFKHEKSKQELCDRKPKYDFSESASNGRKSTDYNRRNSSKKLEDKVEEKTCVDSISKAMKNKVPAKSHQHKHVRHRSEPEVALYPKPSSLKHHYENQSRSEASKQAHQLKSNPQKRIDATRSTPPNQHETRSTRRIIKPWHRDDGFHRNRTGRDSPDPSRSVLARSYRDIDCSDGYNSYHRRGGESKHNTRRKSMESLSSTRQDRRQEKPRVAPTKSLSAKSCGSPCKVKRNNDNGAHATKGHSRATKDQNKTDSKKRKSHTGNDTVSECRKHVSESSLSGSGKLSAARKKHEHKVEHKKSDKNESWKSCESVNKSQTLRHSSVNQSKNSSSPVKPSSATFVPTQQNKTVLPVHIKLPESALIIDEEHKSDQNACEEKRDCAGTQLAEGGREVSKDPSSRLLAVLSETQHCTGLSEQHVQALSSSAHAGEIEQLLLSIYERRGQISHMGDKIKMLENEMNLGRQNGIEAAQAFGSYERNGVENNNEMCEPNMIPMPQDGTVMSAQNQVLQENLDYIQPSVHHPRVRDPQAATSSDISVHFNDLTSKKVSEDVSHVGSFEGFRIIGQITEITQDKNAATEGSAHSSDSPFKSTSSSVLSVLHEKDEKEGVSSGGTGGVDQSCLCKNILQANQSSARTPDLRYSVYPHYDVNTNVTSCGIIRLCDGRAFRYVLHEDDRYVTTAEAGLLFDSCRSNVSKQLDCLFANLLHTIVKPVLASRLQTEKLNGLMREERARVSEGDSLLSFDALLRHHDVIHARVGKAMAGV